MTRRDLPQVQEAARAASPRLFENALLDTLSRVHPAVPPLVYLPLAALLLVWGGRTVGLARAPLLALAGYLAWTLLEYWGHRLAFHFVPRGRLGARLHWMIHGVHHDHPNDRLRLVMPPLMSLPIMAVAFGVFALSFGAASGSVLMAGFLAGYVGYDMLHYHVHQHAPRTRLGRLLRRLHMHHHFRDETVCFGVSAPWWDVVFGTAPRRAANLATQGQDQLRP